MQFSIITLFPEMIQSALQYGVTGFGLKMDLFRVDLINPREFSTHTHKSVDDRPFGGGDGMVLQVEPFERALQSIKNFSSTSKFNKKKIIHLSPKGKKINDELSRELSTFNHLILICSRYSGIDQRFIDQHVELEISLGDFILTGGELAALALIDSTVRHLPGVLGHKDSSINDSFAASRLEYPLYTRPQDFNGCCVPQILVSGNHHEIASWKLLLSFLETFKKRSDLLFKCPPTQEERAILLKALKFSEKQLQFWGLKSDELNQCRDELKRDNLL